MTPKLRLQVIVAMTKTMTVIANSSLTFMDLTLNVYLQVGGSIQRQHNFMAAMNGPAVVATCISSRRNTPKRWDAEFGVPMNLIPSSRVSISLGMTKALWELL